MGDKQTFPHSLRCGGIAFMVPSYVHHYPPHDDIPMLFIEPTVLDEKDMLHSLEDSLWVLNAVVNCAVHK